MAFARKEHAKVHIEYHRKVLRQGASLDTKYSRPFSLEQKASGRPCAQMPLSALFLAAQCRALHTKTLITLEPSFNLSHDLFRPGPQKHTLRAGPRCKDRPGVESRDAWSVAARVAERALAPSCDRGCDCPWREGAMDDAADPQKRSRCTEDTV